MVKNKHKVPKSQWAKLAETERDLFNRVYENVLKMGGGLFNQRLYHAAGAGDTRKAEKHHGTTAWNAAWEAAWSLRDIRRGRAHEVSA